MSEITLSAERSWFFLQHLWRGQRVWLTSGLIVAALALYDGGQATSSVRFTVDALVSTAPFLILSIMIAAWAGASGADNLIARAFTGSPVLMVLLAALVGGLSPFCSCGVIPLIAALLAMGVPLAAVMAFWLASPVTDPSMFVLTAGVLDLEFAVAKTLAAIGLGVSGGLIVHFFARGRAFANPLRAGVGQSGCGASTLPGAQPVLWRFWQDAARVTKFARDARKTTLFLAQWLTLAFLLESLMVAWVPPETITALVGGDGVGPIAIATLVGIPAYLNGYAALPLVGGLIDQGMAPGAGLAFLVAGGVTSIPAAVAVWALVKLRVFALYIGLSLTGAFAAGELFQAWSTAAF